MENNNEYEGSYVINFDKVSKEKDLLSITRMLALQMIDNPYIRVGDFLKNMSESDVNMLVNIIEEGSTAPNFDDIMLMSGMLAIGEGLDCGDVDTFVSRTNQMTGFIICESLFRKGVITVIHENMSFGDDMKDKVIVERLHE
jgi:hypothetical protein